MTYKNTEELVRIAVDSLKDKKADNVRVLDIHAISSCADYFIVASGDNKRQVQTLADNVQEKLKAHGKEPVGIEGYPEASWILLDYNDIVIHIFSQESRFFYDLERIWKDGREVEF
ncbi:MAG: ribosome silencing factor [Clostridiales bacterium]|nr:ribosome silencing factor [Clostridiales bacterium]MBS5877210.1 ribosome silencing factor [Clostridiales bacterium]MDU0938950.1 ribosome silencing factor [Clostridiales bacterium]MDU1041915.1 ribosome silencing factor [Clostridiales bacterium]MDU3490951.1 ribosome silencing factor [Clostridiales bacterium]